MKNLFYTVSGKIGEPKVKIKWLWMGFFERTTKVAKPKITKFYHGQFGVFNTTWYCSGSGAFGVSRINAAAAQYDWATDYIEKVRIF